MPTKINVAMGKSPKRNKKNYGHLNIDSTDLASAKNAKIGDKMTVLVEIEVTGLRKPDKWDAEEYGIPANAVKLSSEILSITENKNAKK